MINQIILENNSPKVSANTLWETLKCILRGNSIGLCSSQKKQREKEINTLLAEIHRLEQTHKEKLAIHTFTTLESKRLQLKSLLDQ